MRNWLVTILIAVVAFGASFGGFYALNREPAAVRNAARTGDAMEWLQAEFKLTPAQFAAIKQLHDQYGQICSRHCSMIMAAQQRGAPKVEIAALESECVRSMTEHFKRVAALMSPAEGKRYLAMVLPRIQDYDHRGAPNLEGRP